MALMNKQVEYQCILCPGVKGKFKTLEDSEKHRLDKHGDK